MVVTNSENEDLITVQELAHKYRVDTSVVRSWVKSGYINYVLVGPRHLQRLRVSEVVKPLGGDVPEPPSDPEPVVVPLDDPDVPESLVPIPPPDAQPAPDAPSPVAAAPKPATRKPLPPMPKKR